MMNVHDNQTGNETTAMKPVYETGFALDDALLYLDTHPDDPDAMEYYRYVRQAYENAVHAYEQKYGPLMFGRVADESWSWIAGPWPWEGGKN
ncbi:MAG: spore coat protein CotJB [Clostridiales bacterium]|nr:spore coat protein CotJB [Clostridiales bacterium]